LGGGEDELLLAKRSQEIGVVHREEGAGDRLLDRFLERDHHRGQAPPESLDSLPLGGPTLPPTMTYWRKLLAGGQRIIVDLTIIGLFS
jgi:hypothetical protein